MYERSGGDDRGNTTNRRRRKLWLLSAESGHGGDGTSVPCHRCRAPLTYETMDVDRIIPGRLGGRYVRENVRPACTRCNRGTQLRVAEDCARA